MKISPGDTAQLSTKITDSDIQAFAELTGDRNPVHLDDAFASRTRFKRRIAHGMLVASQLSKVIANDLPGQGSVYLSQTLKFIAPVYPGDTVTSSVTVLSVREDKPIITLETVCVNQDGQKVITGEAIVLVQPTAEK
jgi:3-hydroxybutyryl-CoA dehydratase